MHYKYCLKLIQWLLFDAIEVIPNDLFSSPVALQHNRYYRQQIVLGKELQTNIQNSSYFLIGAGAIGCEVLKTWAMMGIGCGSKGTRTFVCFAYECIQVWCT